MKVLVIPDIHLKGWMFDIADQFLIDNKAEKALCLMDIPDDWGREYDLEAYRDSFEKMISFAEKHPDTLWCWGNHDLSYIWNKLESGYSYTAKYLVSEYLARFRRIVPEDQIGYIHRIDDTLFMHGGLTESFVRHCVDGVDFDDTDAVIEKINSFGSDIMWSDSSPLWFRPQYDGRRLYLPDKFLQVVGHTPVSEIRLNGSLLSCDVFSTFSDGRPIGTQMFAMVDTVAKTFSGIQ